ncbi:MAG: amino acid permease, partial [Cyclobacteriaceae bacterium]|nr:amino acid permease [Cyclobacteriaceae bacterium]
MISTVNPNHTERPGLRKEIGKVGFFCLAFGAMIGVGWVTAMGPWLHTAGPLGAAIAFVLGGVLLLFIGFCYAEVTAMLPVSGGEVAYAYKAFGKKHSFLVGWFLSFGYLSVSAFEAISVGKILSYLFP